MASLPTVNSLKMVKPKFLYSEEAMMNAIQAVHTQNMSFRKASVTFGVPRSTLENKVKGKTPRERKMGPSSVLTAAEEDTLVKWILSIAKAGFPLIKEDLLCTVQKVIELSNRKTPFTNNKPGKKWFQLFLARHPEISVRVPETLTHSRAKVSEIGLRMWFKEMEDYFCKENVKEVLKDPQRIYNCDEAAFLLCPKTGKVLAPRGCKDVYEIVQGSDKESLTVLMTIRADGVVCPPFIVYPYVRLPSDLVNNAPKSWGLGKSESGWMNGENFYEYIANVFFPWLQQHQINLPVVLFVDGHKSHLTLHLSNFCAEKGIILIALPPNATHIMQPCDVSLFKVMKLKWKQLVHEWRVSNSHEVITKMTFAKMFESVVRSISSECISNGFRRCGIYPFNPDAVDYSKCDKLTEEASMFESTSKMVKKTYLQSLKHLEHFIDENLLNEFNKCFSASSKWNGVERATELYNVWQKMKYNTISDTLVVNTSYSTASNVFNPSTSDVFNPTASYISNPICSDDHNPAASSIPDSTVPNNAFNLTASMSIPAASNISVEVSNSECPASSLISDTFEAEFADLEVLRALSSHTQVNAIDASKNDNNFVIASKSLEINNTRVSSPFKQALFWPETMRKRRKTSTAPKEKIPSVATSSEWQKYYQKKENEKKEKERKKEERRQKRLAKTELLLNKNSKKIKNVQKKKKFKNNNSEDSDSDGEITYDDSPDIDNINLGSLSDDDKETKKELNLMKEHYYAVFYDEQYYIGRIIDLNPTECTVKFLRETMENQYIWPSKTDIATVENHFIFYGPLELSGNVPFSLKPSIIRKIKTAYRQMKQH